MHINLLDAMPAGFIRGMDNYFFHKLTQECRGQFGRLGVLFDNFQKALNVDGLGIGGGHNISQFFYRLLQCGLFLFIALG